MIRVASPSAPSKFAHGARVVVVGHGTGRVVGLLWRGVTTKAQQQPGYEYVVRLHDGTALRFPESLLRAAHPADCEHPDCQFPF